MRTKSQRCGVSFSGGNAPWQAVPALLLAALTRRAPTSSARAVGTLLVLLCVPGCHGARDGSLVVPNKIDAGCDDAGSASGVGPGGVTHMSPEGGIVAGGAHTCAWLADGSARCWGNSRHGQLGDGTRTDSPTPVPVVFRR
ncbi:MAG: RCC1 domain-containing protein [Proteobacteria bacterium]|nr:RCC1 domain-containing protein [Pseudomonadota bacterium]